MQCPTQAYNYNRQCLSPRAKPYVSNPLLRRMGAIEGDRAYDKAQVEIKTALKAGALTDKQADALELGLISKNNLRSR